MPLYDYMYLLPKDEYTSLKSTLSDHVRLVDSIKGDVNGGQVNHIEIGEGGKVVIKPTDITASSPVKKAKSNAVPDEAFKNWPKQREEEVQSKRFENKRFQVKTFSQEKKGKHAELLSNLRRQIEEETDSDEEGEINNISDANNETENEEDREKFERERNQEEEKEEEEKEEEKDPTPDASFRIATRSPETRETETDTNAFFPIATRPSPDSESQYNGEKEDRSNEENEGDLERDRGRELMTNLMEHKINALNERKNNTEKISPEEINREHEENISLPKENDDIEPQSTQKINNSIEDNDYSLSRAQKYQMQNILRAKLAKMQETKKIPALLVKRNKEKKNKDSKNKKDTFHSVRDKKIKRVRNPQVHVEIPNEKIVEEIRDLPSKTEKKKRGRPPGKVSQGIKKKKEKLTSSKKMQDLIKKRMMTLRGKNAAARKSSTNNTISQKQDDVNVTTRRARKRPVKIRDNGNDDEEEEEEEEEEEVPRKRRGIVYT